MGISIFRTGFNSSKCKTMAKMAVARMKLLRNKREVVVRQMRRDIAMLLQTGQDATAHIRVEHVIREQNVMAANEFLELFCELIVARLTIIAEQRDCPADLKEGISSLIFAAPRCSDIPELLGIRDVFEKKYGKDFVSAAVDLRPNAGVNRMLIEKLSVRTPSGEVKLKVLKEIAKEYQVDWDTTESETELLKPPEELLDGPSTFTSASTLPVKPIKKQHVEQPNTFPSRFAGHGNSGNDMMHFKDSAAESAKRAIAAAEVAAYLSSKETQTGLNNTMHDRSMNVNHISNGKLSREYAPNSLSRSSEYLHDKFEAEERMKRSNTFGKVPPSSGGGMFSTSGVDAQKMYRRHSYNVPPAHSDIKFDESDCDDDPEQPPSSHGLPSDWSPNADARNSHRRHSYNVSSAYPEVKYDQSDHEDEGGMEEYRCVKQPPNRQAPLAPHPTYVKQNSVHRVHPKLPDYDTIAARFEALKSQKFQR